MSEGDNGTIINDRTDSRFVFEEDGAKAELLYRQSGSRLILVHTEVPTKLGGRGIGGRLVYAAVKVAESEGLTVVPWCPYARQWLQGHGAEAGTVTVDWTLPD
jgi:predicted GNAT family acetyltransferase